MATVYKYLKKKIQISQRMIVKQEKVFKILKKQKKNSFSYIIINNHTNSLIRMIKFVLIKLQITEF